MLPDGMSETLPTSVSGWGSLEESNFDVFSWFQMILDDLHIFTLAGGFKFL